MTRCLVFVFAAVGACSPPPARPARPLGESTVPVPGTGAAPVVDAAGVPTDPSGPTPPVSPPSGAWSEATATREVAEAERAAIDAGVPGPGSGPGGGSNLPRPTNPPNAPRPTNPGNGSGSGGNPLPPLPAPGSPPPVPPPNGGTPGPSPR